MSHATFRAAIRARYGTFVEDALSLPTLYPNEPPFESDENPNPVPDPKTSTWARFTLQTGKTFIAETSGEQNTFRTPGVLQVQIMGPVGIGDGAQIALADSVAAALRVVSDPAYCLRAASVGTGRRDGDWWRIDVTAEFFADEMA